MGFLLYLFLKLQVLFLRVDKVKYDVECAREDEGQKETEARQVYVSLSATSIVS